MTMSNTKAQARGLARASKSALFAMTATADRASAVNAAIAATLNEMRPTYPWVRTWNMTTDYHFDSNTMPNFLLGIRTKLSSGPSPYVFTYDQAFSNEALGMTLGVFTGNVDVRTRR